MERLRQDRLNDMCKFGIPDENNVIAMFTETSDHGYAIKLIDSGIEVDVWVQTSSAPIDVTIHKFPENEEPIIIDNSDGEIYTEAVKRYVDYILHPPRLIY